MVVSLQTFAPKDDLHTHSFKVNQLLKFLVLIVFSFSLTPSNIFSQSTDLIFEQIFLDQGLSQSIVKCILQDEKGFMYFGTEDGLNRYDGYKFTVIRNDPENLNSISYNDINTIFEDHLGNIVFQYQPSLGDQVLRAEHAFLISSISLSESRYIRILSTNFSNSLNSPLYRAIFSIRSK